MTAGDKSRALAVLHAHAAQLIRAPSAAGAASPLPPPHLVQIHAVRLLDQRHQRLHPTRSAGASHPEVPLSRQRHRQVNPRRSRGYLAYERGDRRAAPPAAAVIALAVVIHVERLYDGDGGSGGGCGAVRAEDSPAAAHPLQSQPLFQTLPHPAPVHNVHFLQPKKKKPKKSIFFNLKEKCKYNITSQATTLTLPEYKLSFSLITTGGDLHPPESGSSFSA